MLQEYLIIIGWILIIAGWFVTYFLLKKKEIETSKYKIKLEIYAKFIEIMYEYSSIDNLLKNFVFTIPLEKSGGKIADKMTEIYNSEAQLRLVAPPNIILEVESLTLKVLDMLDMWAKTHRIDAKDFSELIVSINEQKNKVTNLMGIDLKIEGPVPE